LATISRASTTTRSSCHASRREAHVRGRVRDQVRQKGDRQRHRQVQGTRDGEAQVQRYPEQEGAWLQGLVGSRVTSPGFYFLPSSYYFLLTNPLTIRAVDAVLLTLLFRTLVLDLFVAPRSCPFAIWPSRAPIIYPSSDHQRRIHDLAVLQMREARKAHAERRSTVVPYCEGGGGLLFVYVFALSPFAAHAKPAAAGPVAGSSTFWRSSISRTRQPGVAPYWSHLDCKTNPLHSPEITLELCPAKSSLYRSANVATRSVSSSCRIQLLLLAIC
jgi:hypothetical protein